MHGNKAGRPQPVEVERERIGRQSAISPAATPSGTASTSNSYLVDIATNQPTYRDVRASYFSGKAALPASTSVGVPALAQAGFLIEVEAIAVLPLKA